MKKSVIAWCLCLLAVFGLFIACGKKEAGQTGSDYKGRTLDVLFMVGGQQEMANPIKEKMEKQFPGLTVNVVYDFNAADILRNRVMAGNPPDIFDVNAQYYDKYGAIAEGVNKPLDFLYNVPALDDPSKTLKDVMNFSVMNFGYVDGKYYYVPDSVYTSGLWYDAKMFRDKGWKIPETWDEFVALGEKAKADGKYLLTYSTRYGSEYFSNYWLKPLILSIDPNALGKIENLEPNAWSDPAIVKALTLTKSLLDKGYTDAVSGTLDITETQMEFCNGKVLFYPCGSWLEAEMEGNWPSGFELTYLPFPPQKAGEPSYANVMGVESGIAATTKNEDLVKEYFRYMLTDPEVTTKIIQTTQNGLGINDFASKYGHLLPKSVASSWAGMDSGRVIGFASLMQSFYPQFVPAETDACSALNSGSLSVQAYVNSMNKLADSTRADPSVIKRPYDTGALKDAIAKFKTR